MHFTQNAFPPPAFGVAFYIIWFAFSLLFNNSSSLSVFLALVGVKLLKRYFMPDPM